jgi:hypothetical protein
MTGARTEPAFGLAAALARRGVFLPLSIMSSAYIVGGAIFLFLVVVTVLAALILKK